jgi:hypothetical protein
MTKKTAREYKIECNVLVIAHSVYINAICLCALLQQPCHLIALGPERSLCMFCPGYCFLSCSYDVYTVKNAR